MDEAKRCGFWADRTPQACARLDALRSEKLVCDAYQTTFIELEDMEPRDMPSIRAIFGGERPNYGESVIPFSGEPEAMAAAMLAYKDAMKDAEPGAQMQESKHLSYADEEDKPTQY